MAGKLILIIGPSGSGKSALISYVRQAIPDLIFPVSCTTRPMRPGEVEGETYYFISSEEFDRRVQNGEFLEWASYGGNRYGTLKSEIIPALERGKVVVREVEVQGARQIQQMLPRQNLEIIYIDAGEWEGMEKRIKLRAPIGEVELAARRKRYEEEMFFKNEATYVIENFDGGLEEAKKEFAEVVENILRYNI